MMETSQTRKAFNRDEVQPDEMVAPVGAGDRGEAYRALDDWRHRDRHHQSFPTPSSPSAKVSLLPDLLLGKPSPMTFGSVRPSGVSLL